MERSGRLLSEYGCGATSSDDSITTNSTVPTSISFPHAINLERDFVEALDVIEIAAAYDIPSAILTRIGVFTRQGSITYGLGGGLSSQVVQHITNNETEDILPANTTLALKIFISHKLGDESTARNAKSNTYASVLREVKVYAHPLLRGHDNIAQLRFIAWHQEQPFPMLAMELGNYGTLDHVIRGRGRGSGLSTRQKLHITLDIAVGLQAIHRAGFLHGDLKPENIIIVKHERPSREIVAKLLDFGGSSDGSYGGPAHFTPLWCAPEVASQKSDLDWQKCDVYSYGLIISSIWCRETTDKRYGVDGLESELQSSVLSEITSTAIRTAETDVIQQVRRMQLLDWRDANSLISMLRLQLVTKLLSDDLDAPHLIGVVLSTLWTDYEKRPTADELVDMLAPIFSRLDRDIPTYDDWDDIEEEEEDDKDTDIEDKEPVEKHTLFKDSEIDDSEDDDSNDDKNDENSKNKNLHTVLRWLYKEKKHKVKRQKARLLQATRRYDRDYQAEDELSIGSSPSDDSLADMMIRVKEEHCSKQIDDEFTEEQVEEDDTMKNEASNQNRISWNIGLEASPWWETKSHPYLSLVYQQHVAALGDIPDPMSYIYSMSIRDIPSSAPLSSREFIQTIQETGIEWQSKLGFGPGREQSDMVDKCHQIGMRALYLSMSNLIGVGKPRNRRLGIAWMAVAALYGNEDAIHYCPMVVVGSELESLIPSRLFACIWAFGGSLLYSQFLSKHWPEHLASIQKLRRERPNMFRNNDTPFNPRAFLLKLSVDDDIEVPTNGNFSTIREALEAGSIADARKMLERVNPPEDAADSIPILLRLLISFPFLDADAASLVPLAYQKGAHLDIPRLDHSHGDATLLHDAIINAQILTAYAIIDIHDQFDIPIPSFGTILYSAFLQFEHQLAQRLLGLAKIKPWLCVEDKKMFRASKAIFSDILYYIIPQRGFHQVFELYRLRTHGQNIEQEKSRTINSLLEYGADPRLGSIHQVISYDDVESLDLFVQHLEKTTSERPVSIFKRSKHSSFEQEAFDICKHCIDFAAIRCFEYLLAQNIIPVNTSADNINLLLVAAYRLPASRKFVSILLKYGAEVMARDNDGITALHWALLKQDMVTVEMIADSCTKEQLTDLLRHDLNTRPSIFEALVRADMNVLGISFEGLGWVASHGGAHYNSVAYGCPIWHSIVDKPRPTTRTEQLTLTKILSFLLDLEGFSERANTEPCSHCGLHLIILAAEMGHSEIVRLLLQRNFDTNVCSGLPKDEKNWGGQKELTALDYAWNNLKMGYVPQEFRHGAHLEFTKWHECLLEVVDLLVAAGAKSDVLYWDRRLAVMGPSPNKQHQDMISILQGGKVVGSWPEPLPSTTLLKGDKRFETLSDSASISSESTEDDDDVGILLSNHQDKEAKHMSRNLSALFWAKRSNVKRPIGALLPGRNAFKDKSEEAMLRMPQWTRPDYVEGNTNLLHIAALKNDTEALKSLLDNNPDIQVDLEDEFNFTALNLAVWQSNEEAVRILFEKGASINRIIPHTCEGVLPIHMSVAQRDAKPSLVKLLLDMGADPNCDSLVLDGLDGRNYTALTICIQSHDRPDIIQTLLQGGARLDHIDDPFSSPLAVCIINGRPESLELLLPISDIPWKSPDGMNLLQLAAHCRKFNVRMMKILLEFAAHHLDSPQSSVLDINAVDDLGDSALGIAMLRRNRVAVKFLLRQGIDVNLSNGMALYGAAFAGDKKLTRRLLLKGADPNLVETDSGCQPLYAAASLGHYRVVKTLLVNNADVNGVSKNGETALFAAARNRSVKIVQLLLDREADIHVISTRGETPLLCAVRNKNRLRGWLIAKLLLEKRASLFAATNVETPFSTVLHQAARAGNLGDVILSGIMKTNIDVRGIHRDMSDFRLRSKDGGSSIGVTTESVLDSRRRSV